MECVTYLSSYGVYHTEADVPVATRHDGTILMSASPGSGNAAGRDDDK
jgi:hypothetical protein